MAKKPLDPWDFIPSDTDSRYNFPQGMGWAQGKAKKNAQGRVRDSSILRPPKDKTKGFKKGITTT